MRKRHERGKENAYKIGGNFRRNIKGKTINFHASDRLKIIFRVSTKPLGNA